MIRNILKISILFCGSFFFCGILDVGAESININANDLVSRVEVYFSPRSGTFAEGSTFDVPIFINTKGISINGIEIIVNFDKNKLSVIQPSGEKSIIGIWVRPPVYDNSKGTVTYTGVVPDGITSSTALISTITFKAVATGKATVSLSQNSKILLNDGLGTETIVNSVRSEYEIIPKAPEGVVVFSETHPVQSSWYNNNSPIISWERGMGIEGFSFVLDDKPTTIPINKINSTETTTDFKDLKDGLWYFHIKANKKGVWGTTGHFLIKIDSTPPADFKPESNYVVAAIAFIERSLVSFFTTDNLSGVDHYEVGVIDKKQPATESPVFIESSSPYQVPLAKSSDLRVIVRAVDKAGNIKDAFIDVKTPFVITKFVEDYLVYILSGIILIGFIMLILHYLLGHHIVRYLRRIVNIAKREEEKEENLSNNLNNEIKIDETDHINM